MLSDAHDSPNPTLSAATMPIGVVLAAGLVAAGAYYFLGQQSRTSSGVTLSDLYVASLVALVAVAILAARFWLRGDLPSKAAVLAFAGLFLSLGVLGEPILEDDPFRYRLDGWVFATQGSPYGIPPSEFFERDVPDDVAELLDEVNNPDIPTIYGPTLQWIFRACHAVAGTSLWPIQIASALCTFALLCLVARRAHPLALAFVAWHPLVIKEFAFTAHPDAIAVMLLVFAFVPRGLSGSSLRGGLFGLAVGAKVFAILAGPWLLWRAPRACIAFAIVLAALYAPFVPTLFGGSPTMTEPHSTMGLEWIFNAPAYFILDPILGRFLTLGCLGALFAFVLLWEFRWSLQKSEDPSQPLFFRGERIFGVMLLVSPVINAWYLIWPLAFFPRAPSVALGLASYAIFLAYASGLHLARNDLAAYEITPNILAIEWGLLGMGLMIDFARRLWKRSKEGSPASG